MYAHRHANCHVSIRYPTTCEAPWPRGYMEARGTVARTGSNLAWPRGPPSPRLPAPRLRPEPLSGPGSLVQTRGSLGSLAHIERSKNYIRPTHPPLEKLYRTLQPKLFRETPKKRETMGDHGRPRPSHRFRARIRTHPHLEKLYRTLQPKLFRQTPKKR